MCGLLTILSVLVLACGDASQSARPDGPLETGCGKPGELGNSLGVGKYCTRGGHECASNSFALFCTVTYEPSAPAFCTNACTRDPDCGDGAYCSGSGMGLTGCLPAVCGGRPMSDAGF
jgi:hypothetical protein